MLVEHFAAVLWVTGEAGLFLARHWGLLAASIGGLLLFAAAHPELRPAVVTAALVEKAGIVVAFLLARNRPFARGLRLVAAFDALCVLLYAIWLATS